MNQFELNNGIKIPQIGLGTFLLSPLEAENSTYLAIKNGYRLIDTANAYMNEKGVGRGIRRSGVDRNELFISSKLWPSEYSSPHAVEDTLSRLGLEYLDLLFIHQPTSNWRDGYSQLVKAYKEHKILSIGVSNFEGEYINELLSEFDVIPQVIQVECHPAFTQEELRNVVDKENIKIMSWFPLGGRGMTNDIIGNPIVSSLATKYHKTPSQIVLRWHVEMGFIPIPGSKSETHIKENVDIFDFALTKEDMDLMAKLNRHTRKYIRTDENLKQYQNMKLKYEE